MKCKLIAVILCVLLSASAFAGCSQVKDMVQGVTTGGEFPVEVEGVTISGKPQKVVVLSPGLADVVLALGYETQLAAGSEDCTQEGLSSLAKVNGNDSQAVIDLAPDLVLANSFSDDMAAALSGANISALALSPATDREDFERLYSQVSQAFAGGGVGYDAGIQTAQGIFTTLDDINRIVPKEKITTACYLYDLNGSAVTGDMFGSVIMSYAGVTNVFKSLTGGTYDFESLRISNPNAIFCAPGLADQIRQDERFQGFQAVVNNNIFEMEPSLMEWQGRTVVTSAYEISAACFPELLESSSAAATDPTDKIDSAVSSAMTSSTPEADVPRYETLQQGDQNEDVLAMQTRLEELGYLDVEYDGHYGEHTAGCVREFQRVNGLNETGIANDETQRVLFSDNAKAKGSE